MWTPDDEYVVLHDQLEAMSGSLGTLHQRLIDDPVRVSNRRDAIALLRNLDAAFASFRIDAPGQSAVQKAANLSDSWQQTFNQTIDTLNGQIATLRRNIKALSPLQVQEARLEEEENQLRIDQRALESLEERARKLPALIKHREELEAQIAQLQHEQQPELARIEVALITMRGLLEGAAEYIANATAKDLAQAQNDRTHWLAQQHAAENELANLKSSIVALTSENERIRDEIAREQATTNSVQEEHARLVKEHLTHLELNRELNDALRAFGHDDGVEGINERIAELGRELKQLDAGLQNVLQTRQEALARQGKRA